MDIVGTVLIIVSLAAGLAFGWVLAHRKVTAVLDRAKAHCTSIKAEAALQAEAGRRESEEATRRELEDLRGKEERILSEQEARLLEKQLQIATLEEQVNSEKEQVGSEKDGIEQRRKAAEQVKTANRKLRDQVGKLKEEGQKLLEAKSNATAAQARERVIERLMDKIKASCADRLRNLETELQPEASRVSKRILGISIGRYLPEPSPERQTSLIKLTDKDMAWFKGEAAPLLEELSQGTSVILSLMEGEAALRLESSDGVARELIRRAVDRLMTTQRNRNGKVKVDVLISALQKELDKEIQKAGQKAFAMLSLPPAHPKICELVGRLAFRTSYSQNQYHHSLEAAVLSRLMALELGLDPDLAARGGLIHDIGKALTHEVEGSHALIGAELAEKHGEAPEVVDAIASHHGDRPPETVYARLVAAADAVSGARPGARRELMEAYVDRIQELERVASGFSGVAQAYAVQAGRELRIVVDERTVDDEKAADLAQSIARKVSEEVVFPGQVKITVIRELSVVATAG